MAQTNYTPISLYYSATASSVPVNTNLVAGELAINTNDGKLFYKDSSGVVQVLATKATTAGTFASITDSGLTSGRVTFASTGGLLTDSANLTFSGSNLTASGNITAGDGSAFVFGTATTSYLSGSSSSNILTFYTNSSERARMTAGGSFYVGCTSVPGAGTTTVGCAVDGNGYISTFRTNATTAYFARSNDGEVVALFSGTTQRGTISISGATTTYGSVSDYRLKENIVSIDNALNIVLKLKPSTYNFKEFPDSLTHGFIAHELQTEIPEAVIGKKDAVKEDGSPEYQSIDMAKIVPFLTKAIQEQQALITDLTNRLTALEK